MDDMKKILLVEDDEFMRDIYVNILKDAGYMVEMAVDGEEAYVKMKQGGWDLILLDVLLPKMNGDEALKKLKAENGPAFSKKVIFLTNLDSSSQLADLKTIGDGYLAKSDLNPGQFLQRVKLFLQ